MVSREYECLFSRNYDKKNKTWRDGILLVHGTHRFARGTLYEVDDRNRMTNNALDTFDLLNHKYDRLAGEMITSPKFIVKISGFKNSRNKIAPVESRAAEVRQRPLLACISVPRTPSLGTCGAFRKYHAPTCGIARTTHALPARPSYCDQYRPHLCASLEDKTERIYELDALVESPSFPDPAPPYGSQQHPDRSKIRRVEYESADTKARTKKSAPAPASFLIQEATNSQQLLPTKTQQHTSESIQTLESQDQLASPLESARMSTATPSAVLYHTSSPKDRHKEKAGVFEEFVLPHSNTDLFVSCPSQEHSEASLYDGMLAHAVKSESDSSESPEFEDAPVVDPELIGCIESALGHFDKCQDDF